MLTRRSATLLALNGLATPALAQAQGAAEYPTRLIRLVLPSGAGSGADALGRLIANEMSKKLGQPIVVENRPGAGGRIGTHYVTTVVPDGYTFMIGTMTTHVLSPALYPRLNYHPTRDFVTLGRIGNSPIMMIATLDFPANNLQELRALSLSKPNGILYASWGLGSTGHFCGEVLVQRASMRLEHVPYNESTRVLTDMLGGRIQLAFVDMASGTPFVRDGKVKPLALCTERSPAHPTVPGFSEQGIDFSQTTSWVAYAPVRVPAPIAERLSSVLEQTLKENVVIEGLLKLGVAADFVPGPEQARITERDIGVWRQIAREARLEFE